MQVKTCQEYFANNETPEIVFWVGCAGSFDQRAQKVTRAFVEILQQANIAFAILGKEEMCTGDPARRAGNEFLFQMMAYNNIQTLNMYGVKKIVTTCPHCFNTLKNEYPELGGQYEVLSHAVYLQELLRTGRIQVQAQHPFNQKRIAYHDSCYLGRANDIYEAPREVLENLHAEMKEMKHCKSTAMCCGAGGGQMFKEEEAGSTRVNWERSAEAVAAGADIIAANCPFCITMLQDGVKKLEVEEQVKVMDLAELIAQAIKPA